MQNFLSLSDIISITIAIIALGFSIVTYFKNLKKSKDNDFHSFLLHTTSIVTKLDGLLFSLISNPESQDNFWKEWPILVQEYAGIFNEFLLWKDKPIYKIFMEMHEQFANAGKNISLIKMSSGKNFKNIGNIDDLLKETPEYIKNTFSVFQKYLDASRMVLEN